MVKKLAHKKKTKKNSFNLIFAYTDESGNTGENLFDREQPWFWTGTLFCTTDIELLWKSQLQKWGNILGVQELHGSHIRLEGLEKVAKDFISLLRKGDYHFHFTLVEKIFLATTKLTFTLLDSTTNKALLHTLFFTSFRGILELALFQIIKPRDCRDFWEVYKTHDLGRFRGILERLQLRVLINIHEPRIKQLLDDAIRWAIFHPEEILETKRTGADSPNLVAFSSIFDHSQEYAKKKNAKIGRFYHDEQTQFMTEMNRTYAISSCVSGKLVGPLEIPQIEQNDTFNCPFEMMPSSGLVGLQIVDCILWLLRKSKEKGVPQEYPGCRELLEYVEARSSIFSYDFRTYSQRLREKYEEINSLPLTAEQLHQGKIRLEAMEQERLKNMR